MLAAPASELPVLGTKLPLEWNRGDSKCAGGQASTLAVATRPVLPLLLSCYAQGLI